MENTLVNLFSVNPTGAVLLAVKLTLSFFVVRYIKDTVIKLLQYVLVIAHDSAYGVVYLIDGEHWAMDRVTFNYVMLTSLDDSRYLKQIPIKNWATLNRTIVLTNKTTCNIKQNKSK